MTVLSKLTMVGAVALAAFLGATGAAWGADECRGLQVCLPVPGPWVAIPAPSGGGVPSVTWQMRCPLRGYIVAGIDARVSDRSIDVSIRGENGAPVSPGVTTGREVLFTAVYTGGGRRATSFRPFIGCVPTSGGGGRGQTSVRRTTAFAPGSRSTGASWSGGSSRVSRPGLRPAVRRAPASWARSTRTLSGSRTSRARRYLAP